MDECEWLCYQDHACVSINFNTRVKENGKHWCVLNNSTHAEHEGDLIEAKGYIYRGTEVSTLSAINIDFEAPFTLRQLYLLCVYAYRLYTLYFRQE